MGGLTIGLDPRRVTENPEFGIGSFGSRDDSEYIYVKASQAIGEVGEVVAIHADDSDAVPLVTPTTNLVGRRVGVAPGPVAANSYFWALVRGRTQFLAAANCAANSSLRATTVGGVVDDAGSGPVIEGMVTAIAAGSMQELVVGRLIYPTLQEAGTGGGGTTTGTVSIGTSVEIAAADLAAGADANVAHGLGAMPDGINGFMECTTANRGYAVGDRVPIQVPWQMVFSYNATHVYIACRNSSFGFDLVNQDGSATGRFTVGSWKVVGTPFLVST